MEEKVIYTAFRIFLNRIDSYAIMKEGLNEYFVIKKGIYPDLLIKHINGESTIGVFQLSHASNVKWVCWDFDSGENKSIKDVFEEAKKLFSFLKNKGYHPLLEFSGMKGYHVWIFCQPTNAKNAKEFAEKMCNESGIHPHEIFPKQIILKENGYGCMVKLPLGIHRVSRKRSIIYNNNFEELNLDNAINRLLNQKINKIPTYIKKLSSF
jgi:hypothetical protein